MPRGANPKREREYEKLKTEFKREGRYRGREEEVASRIVNKQRAQYGETRKAKRQEKEGKAPDRGLPISRYRHMTIPKIEERLKDLSPKEVRKIESYEKKHKNRKGVLRKIERRLEAA